jgi:carbon-monoxide dehydrogenase large subunit
VDDLPLLGTPVTRVEDPPLLRGDARFVGDLELPGALAVHFVTSVRAHAEIAGVAVDAARAAPGVVDVVTAADVELAPMAGSLPGVPEGTERPVLARDRARFVGEPIAAVVATTIAAAVDAAELVVVDYRPLPAVVRAGDALGGEVLLFPHVGTNVMTTEAGGTGEAFDPARYEVVVDAELVNQRLAPCPIETRVAASYWTDDGRLVHHASCQGPHPIRQALAAYYGLDPADARVVTRHVGGSFGSKARLYPEDLLLPLLARRAGRPVRWVPDRSADMVGLGHSRAQRQRVRIVGDRTGRVHAIDADVVADCGAYPVVAPVLARNTGTLLPGSRPPTSWWPGPAGWPPTCSRRPRPTWSWTPPPAGSTWSAPPAPPPSAGSTWPTPSVPPATTTPRCWRASPTSTGRGRRCPTACTGPWSRSTPIPAGSCCRAW